MISEDKIQKRFTTKFGSWYMINLVHLRYILSKHLFGEILAPNIFDLRVDSPINIQLLLLEEKGYFLLNIEKPKFRVMHDINDVILQKKLKFNPRKYF